MYIISLIRQLLMMYTLCLSILTRKPPAEAALVVTYLQFPIQVCFPCIGQPVIDFASVTVTNTFLNSLVVLIIVMIIIFSQVIRNSGN